MKFSKTATLSVLFVFAISFAKAQNNIDNITGAYYGIKNALAASHSAEAAASAKTMLAALSSPGNLNAGQQKAFDAYAEKLKFDSRHISESTDIDHQREHFASLSKNWYEVLKALKINKAPVYMDYCPMKKAYWLSETAAIKNPYYSDMSDCGRVSATLPAAK